MVERPIRRVNCQDGKMLIVDEPTLVDRSLRYYEIEPKDVEQEDNVCIYVPMHINREAIIRRLNALIYQFQEANYKNEIEFSMAVDELVWQIEIYDQLWRRREETANKHSYKGLELMEEFVELLKEIPDGCTECFPFELIDELEAEYQIK